MNVGDFIFIPNAFTPNNDGKNDVFKVRGKYINNVEMSIYNRWGELLFYSPNATEGWDGTFQNENAPEGVYTIFLNVKSDNQSLKLQPVYNPSIM